jgi:glycosyltransferase involved in cell wall biosynthesis
MSARVCCVIPAFDAAATVGIVVRDIRIAMPGAAVVVVDDGSRDDTALQGAEADHVLRHPVNRGKGAALRSGIAYALETDCEVIVALDADGQHPPASMAALVGALADADLAIGVRARAGAPMPLARRASNALSSAVVSALAGQRIPDSQSGFRAMRADVAREVRPKSNRFEFETEFVVRAARAGFRIAGVPVPTVYDRGRGSHFRHVRDTTRVALAMARLSWTRFA